MTRGTKTVALLLLTWLGAFAVVASGQDLRGGDPGGGPARPAEAGPPVDVRTSVSRTAVWVGDRVVYTIELRCAPGVDILLDDLLKERLRVEGGEIVAVNPERTDANDRIIHRIAYTLVTYRVDVTAIHVASVPVRYYARGRGGRLGDAAPAGEISVPPLSVTVGSTVPVIEQAIALREPAGVRPAPAALRLAQPVGLGLVLLAIVPAAFSVLGVTRHARRWYGAYAARQSHGRHRGSFDRIKSLQPGTDEERVEAYKQLDEFLRDHLAMSTGLPAHALTPAAMKRRLQERNLHIPSDAIEAVLEACERARYAPDPPSAAGWADVVRDTELLLDTSRR